MRGGLLKTLNFDNDLLSRLQDNIEAAVEALAADHDVVSAPVNSLVITSAIGAGKAINWYRGAPGAVLTLPLANALDGGAAPIVIIANASAGAITVLAAPTNTLTGTAGSIASGTCVVLVSDGVNKWAAHATGASGGLTDGNKGDITVSGGGTA
jgi:hypothetical protein